MRRIADLLRAFIVSFEMVWLLLMILVDLNFRSYFTLIGEQFRFNTEIWKFLPTLSLLFTGLAFKLAGKVRAPLPSPYNKRLYEWPQYHRLKDRVYISLFLCVMSCIGALAIWMFADKMATHMIATIFLSGGGISGIAVLTVYLASHKLREILEKYS